MASGGKVDMPSLHDRLKEFEAWLISEPKHMDPEELELRQALGVR